MEFEYTEQSLKQLFKLPRDLQQRIQEKVLHWEKQENPLLFAKPLAQFKSVTHRFRIGDYRLVCKREPKVIIIIKIGHRSTVYKCIK